MKLSTEFESRYAIEPSSRTAGRGGTGFRAIERATGKRVTVKMLDRGASQKDPDAAARLIAMLDASCKLDHPNLQKVKDVEHTPDGRILIVADYVEGETLRERGQKRGRMDWADALAAAKGMLAGLASLHAHGLDHGDLKMENVVLSTKGWPVLVDHALPPVRRPGALPTNPANVAPELLEDCSRTGPSADIYAAGTLLYELLTGAPPFPGPDPSEILRGHQEVVPMPPSARADDIPDEVDALVERALKKDPAQRFATADEMIQAISAALRQRPTPPLLPGGRLNVLLLCMPVAIAGHLLGWSEPIVFGASCLAIVPLAAILGEATEHLAEHVGPGLGGLLNATFGNATELLISLFGIWRGGMLIDTVKASLTGSILGNLLFIMGSAMLLGGLRREKQTFNRTSASVGNSLMILAIAGLLIPSIVHAIYRADPRLAALEGQNTQRLSLAVAIILLITYFLSLVFSLKTHRHLSVPEVEPTPGAEEASQLMPRSKAMILLAGATLCVSVMSEALVSSVEKTGEILHLNPLFMGLVVISMVGNAAEHATAVMVGIKDKMDLANAIAMGSSVQVALFIAPFLVVVSWVIGRPIDLVFSPMEVVAVMLAVGATISVNLDGESTWIEGALLLAVYAILAAAFWFMPYAPTIVPG